MGIRSPGRFESKGARWQASGLDDTPSAELLALNRTSRGVLLHAIASAALLLILVDMIWKPGA